MRSNDKIELSLDDDFKDILEVEKNNKGNIKLTIKDTKAKETQSRFGKHYKIIKDDTSNESIVDSMLHNKESISIYEKENKMKMTKATR